MPSCGAKASPSAAIPTQSCAAERRRRQARRLDPQVGDEVQERKSMRRHPGSLQHLRRVRPDGRVRRRGDDHHDPDGDDHDHDAPPLGLRGRAGSVRGEPARPDASNAGALCGAIGQRVRHDAAGRCGRGASGRSAGVPRSTARGNLGDRTQGSPDGRHTAAMGEHRRRRFFDPCVLAANRVPL